MKKVLTIFAVISLLWGISALFIQSKVPNEKQKALSEILISGKWLNQSDNYTISNENDTKVERYKTFRFLKNNTFVMDSAKQKYNGKWEIKDSLVLMTFAPKEVSHLYLNDDPNKPSNVYTAIPETINLSTRTGTVTDGILALSDGFEYENLLGGIAGVLNFYEFSGFANVTFGHIVMMFAGFLFIFLAIKYDYEPLLLIPIGVGILIGNIPMFQVADFNLKLGIYEPGSVMNILYQGVVQGWYPPLIFLGIGAMTDFSTRSSSPSRYFHYFYWCVIFRFCSARSRCNWYYWRCRWSNGDFYFIKTCKRNESAGKWRNG